MALYQYFYTILVFVISNIAFSGPRCSATNVFLLQWHKTCSCISTRPWFLHMFRMCIGHFLYYFWCVAVLSCSVLLLVLDGVWSIIFEVGNPVCGASVWIWISSHLVETDLPFQDSRSKYYQVSFLWDHLGTGCPPMIFFMQESLCTGFLTGFWLAFWFWMHCPASCARHLAEARPVESYQRLSICIFSARKPDKWWPRSGPRVYCPCNSIDSDPVPSNSY